MHPYYLKTYLDIVPKNSRILDLGCGNGDLLATLKQHKQIKGYGVDKKKSYVLDCLKKGISIYQGNIEEWLKEFSNQSFDIVILSQTLQQIENPVHILNESLRVGKKVIISFPNFAYWKLRFQLLLGKAPRSKSLPFTWYNTPNIRIISIYDFKELCQQESITICKEHPLFESKWARKCFKPFANLMSKKALFVIQRSPTS